MTATRRTRLADPVSAYARRVVARKVLCGRLQRLACKRHLEDLKRSSRRGSRYAYRFDVARANWAISFFPNLRHWRGELAGTPLEITGPQKFIIGCIFGWVNRHDGTYRFDTAYVEWPKKNGKTTTAAVIALLKGFYDGEQGAEVFSIATKRDQAKLCWNEAAHIVQATRWLREKVTVLWGRANIHNLESASKFEPLGADKDTADGVNPNCVIADEVHRYKSSELLNTVKKSMVARRNPLTFEITTAGWNKNTICWKHHELSVKVLEGTVKNEEWFAFIACADENDKDKWDDPKVWQKANPNWGVSVDPAKVAAEAKVAAQIPSERNDFLRFHLNLWTEQAERWLPMEKWKKSGVGSMPLEELRGRECFAGLDLASNRDLCAFVLLLPIGDKTDEEREYHLLSWFWCPEVGVAERSKEDGIEYAQWVAEGFLTATDGDTADHRIIKRDILRAIDGFQLRVLAYDPHNSGNLPLELQEEGLTVVKHYQGFGNMAAPTKEMERLVLNGRWKHGDNPVLNWMASNVAVRRNEYDDMKIDKQKSSEKVDGMVAAAMALGACMNYEKQDEDETSIYDVEERGLFTF